MFKDKEAFKSDHVILDKNTLENDLKDFSFTFLELPKFKKGKKDLKTMIDKWAYYFKHANEITPDYLKALDSKEDQPIKRAYNELEQFYWSEKELNTYEAILKKQMDYANSMEGRFEAGERVGLEKGREEGREETLKKTITSMLKKGKSASEIAELLDLAENEVERMIVN